MTEKLQESLANFMKKQASSKALKQNDPKKSGGSFKKDAAKKIDEATGEEEMSDEEKLEEAKKVSRGKAQNYGPSSEMIKKMFIEYIAKYTLMIVLLVGFAYGVIKLSPAFFEFMHGLFFNLFVGSLK